MTWSDQRFYDRLHANNPQTQRPVANPKPPSKAQLWLARKLTEEAGPGHELPIEAEQSMGKCGAYIAMMKERNNE
jgi:hypothetical protein